MIRVLIMLLFFIIHSSVIFSENFSHSFQVSLNLAKSYYSNGAQVAIPIEGTRNVRLEIVDVVLDQPIWSQKSDQYISKGEISVIVKDEKINWHEMFKSRELVFRVEILDDLVDIPFRSLPYAIFSDHASRARQFTNTDFVNIDYKNKKIIINNVTANGQLVVSGSVLATELIGDGSQLKNLTGPGFSTGYSLNSENSQYKDVLFVSNSGNVGINVTTPSARLHIRGNAAFQPLKSNIEEFYTVPTGSILLWDPARSAFRSGVFTRVFSSNDIGKYSVAFGEDVISKALYSSIIAGEDHLISNIAVSSVIIGGQSHKIMDTNSVIVGGFDNLINGEWSVIFGGSNHNIHGPYNVLLGGKENKIVGELNTSIGRLNELVGDYVTVIGNMNKVSANTSVALGQSVSIRHENSFVYSDGYQPAKSQQDHQFIVMPRNGLGINMAPMDNVMLNVSGNIKAIRLKGDGQYLRNIISGQDYWKQRIEGGQRVGIYYMDGPVSVGTKLNYANLTVSGGITIQDSAQASNVANGTIRFTSENGLQLFHNQWVSLDQVDTNTLLTNGRGISLVNQTFGLDQMGAALKNAFIFNGSIWAPTDPLFWINYDKGILLDSKLELITTDKQVNAPLIIESNASGTKTKHPFVFGGANSLIFSPLNSEVFFNLDYTDDTHSKYKLFNSSDDSVGLSSFGASIRVKNDRLSISQTDKAYHSDEVVNMQSRLNLSPTSAFTTVKPRATLDINGSVGFLNTFFNQNLENGTKGIGHFNLYNNDYSHYLFFDSNQNLNLNSGTDSLTQPINFNISGSKKAYFDINGNFIIGTENARARLSIFGGGVAMNVNGSQVMSSYRSGHHTSIRSRSNSDPSIELFNNSTLLSTFGSRSFAIGATNNANVLLLSSAQYPTIDIISKSKSELMLSNLNSHYNIKNDNGIFSISQIKSNNSNPIIHLDDDNHISFFTSTFSNAKNEIVVSGDIALSNTDKLHFLTNQRRPVMDLYKNSNQLIFQQKNTKPFLFNTQAGQTIMSVSNNRLIAINKSEPSANANLYVDGDVLFNEPVFYKNAGDQLIQAFVINQKSNDVANNKEVRSVKSLTVDETSGLGLSVSPSENKIVFHAPDYYYRIYETPLMDGFVPNGGLQYIEPVGKDIIEFKEVLPNGGVSINLVDTNSDGVKDSIRFFNPLMNGGVINGTITVNGQVYLNGSNGNGTEVTSIPFKWKLKYNDLYYSSGNVGINTKSPNYDFEVNDLMQSDRIYISNELFNQRIQLNNATSTTTNQKISFLIDSNNSNSNDQFQISTTSNALLTFTGDSIANNHRYGFFTNSPQAILHAENLSGKEGVLFQSLPSGVSGLTLTTLTNNSAYIQLNSNIDNNKLGKINEGLIATSRNILFTTNGDTNPSLYLKENSVSIGLDETKNTLFANGSMTVGADYAGITQNDASTGLTIEGKLYVGHLTTADPGSNLFVKDSLSVGRNVNKIIPQNFKGVIVSRNLGVNVAKPLDRFSINGGARLKSDILFYKDDTPIFQLLPNQFKLIEGGYGMDFYLPDLMSFHVNNTKRLSIFSNSVTFGTFADKTTNNFYLYNETGDATLFLEDTNAPPSITFESKNGSVKGKIGIMPNGASTKVLIESNGDTLSNPDITITEGKVGVGKMPAYAMDINGGVKTENLYQNNDRLYPVPQGVIVMWSGTKASIPAGWALCDGQSGRPNLTDKFIMGADLANIGKTGGKNAQSIVNSGAHRHIGGGHGNTDAHPITGGDHNHSISISYSKFNNKGDTESRKTPFNDGQNHRGNSNTDTNYHKGKSHHHSISTNHNHGTSNQSNGGVHHTQQMDTSGAHEHAEGEHDHSWNNEPEHYMLAFIIKISDT